MSGKNAQTFLSRLQTSCAERETREAEIEENAKKHAEELREQEARQKAREEAGVIKPSPWRRKLSVFKKRQQKKYNKLPLWLKIVLWPVLIAVLVTTFFGIQFMVGSAVVLGVLTLVGSIIAKIVIFAPKITKSLFVFIKAGTRTYTGTKSTKARRKLFASDEFAKQRQGKCVQVKNGWYFKNTYLMSKSGQKVMLKHSTFDYGLDGFRIMNVYTIAVIPAFVGFYLLGLVWSLLLTLGYFAALFLFKAWKAHFWQKCWQKVKSAFEGCEKTKQGNFFTWSFWKYLIFNFKTAYVRMDKPEDVGPVYAKKANIFVRVYRWFAPQMVSAVDTSQPQNIQDELSSKEAGSDIAISAITAPGVGAALAMGDLTTALLLLDNTGMMIGAGENQTKCGHKIFVIPEEEAQYVCIPADMDFVDAYDTEAGMVIHLKGRYARPKVDLQMRWPMVSNLRNEPQTYEWEILVEKPKTAQQ